MGVLREHCNHLLATDRLRKVTTAAKSCAPRPQKPRRAKQEHRFLTEDAKALLVASYVEGASLRQLASDHGVHRSTVSSILKESGTTKRPRGMSMEQVERAHQMRAQGLSLSALASAMDLPSTTIRSALIRNGLWNST